MQRFIDKLLGILLAAIACLGLIGCYKIAVALGSKKDFWDVATAIGTCGAVVVALGIAIWQETARRAERLIAAKMTSTYMRPRLETIRDATLKTFAALLGDGIEHSKLYTAAVGEAHRMRWTPPPEQLILLAPLPRAAGYRATRAFALVNSIAFDMSQSAQHFPRDRDDDFGAELIHRWRSQLEETVALLNTVIDDMRSIDESVR